MKLTPLVIGTLLLLISACATVGNRPAPPSPAEELENAVELPQAANGLEQVSRRVFDNPQAGIGYQYAGEEMRADVFVYPLNDTQMDVLLEYGEDALITAAYNDFRGEMEYVTRAGKYDSYTPLKEVLVNASFSYMNGTGETTVPFIIAVGEFEIMANGRKFLSYVYLTEFKGYFIKIRATQPESPLFAQSAAAFMQELLNQVYEADVRKPVAQIKAEGSGVGASQRPGESLREFMKRGLEEIAKAGKQAK